MEWLVSPLDGFASGLLSGSAKADECSGGGVLNACSCTGGLLSCSCNNGLTIQQSTVEPNGNSG